MKCPKPGCGGTLYRFRPEHLVAAWYRAGTGARMELDESQWKQVGLMCGTCGYLEFYAENPKEVLSDPGDYFESTEPEPQR